MTYWVSSLTILSVTEKKNTDRASKHQPDYSYILNATFKHIKILCLHCDKNKILEFFAKLLMRMQLTPLIHKVTFAILLSFTLLKE